LIDHYGGARSTNKLTNLKNKIRSYALGNPNADLYSRSATDEFFNEAIKRIGK